jgi:hypothetical protein
VLIAMLPVSLYNRSALSADGAALSSALVITALCLRAARKSAAGPHLESTKADPQHTSFGYLGLPRRP